MIVAVTFVTIVTGRIITTRRKEEEHQQQGEHEEH